MDIAEASASGPSVSAASGSAAPWIAVGVLLAVAALLLAALVTALVLRRRTAARPEEATPQSHAVDDLPGFLESPPGSAAPAAPGVGPHVALAAPPPAPPVPARQAPVAALAAAAGVAVLLLAAAVAVALTSVHTSPGRDSPADGPADDGRPRPPVEVRMSFPGLVLEQRAVGITATYPEVELTADREGPVARLTLPTWNCLAAEAPDDPEAAGCVPTRTEYAELRPPALEVTRNGHGLRFGGDFPTSTRPTGSAPEPTGRTYPVEVSVPVDGERCPERRSAARGVLVLGTQEAESVEGELRLDC